VRPIGDARRVSHEEMSYVVDSTASPIASVLAFNAWPAYVAALTFVPGIAFLATEQDRIAFFFECIPLSFYSLFAVLGTLLLCFDKLPLIGRGLSYAAERARATGALDAPGAKPMSSKELETTNVPPGYRPHSLDFFLPLILLIGVAIGSFIAWGAPEVHWAFGAAVLMASLMALSRGMSLSDLMEGIGQGFKGVVYASVILMLAITIGAITREVGGGRFLVDQLGQSLPFWLLPAALVTLTVIIAFSTGTSFGTYAVAFPLAMPLAWAIAENQQLDHPKFYLMICFASVLNGSVFGDQCSPISDTTILSSMTTGADLMDHVRTQLVPASVAMTLAVGCWTMLALFAA
jgi:Na+/H+ antiporter NhaC